MLVVFLSIFVGDAKITFVYNMVTPLISFFEEFFASIKKILILARRLGTKLSLYEV